MQIPTMSKSSQGRANTTRRRVDVDMRVRSVVKAIGGNCCDESVVIFVALQFMRFVSLTHGLNYIKSMHIFKNVHRYSLERFSVTFEIISDIEILNTLWIGENDFG